MPLPSGDGPVSSLESKGASSEPSARRQYRVWSEKDSECVTNYFQSYIKTKGKGSQGPLPGIKDVKLFLETNEIFPELNVTPQKMIALVKTKVFNERKKYRQHLENIFPSY